MANIVILIGNLGADPELVTTQKGNSVLKMRVATDERIPDGNGGWRDAVEWHRCTMFGKRAEALYGILIKGSKVGIRGRNSTSSYEKDNVKHYSTEVIIDDLELLANGRPRDAAQPAAAAGAPGAPPPPPAAARPGNGRPPPPPAPQVLAEPPAPRDTIGEGYVYNRDINNWEYKPELRFPKGTVINNANQPLDTTGRPMVGGAPF